MAVCTRGGDRLPLAPLTDALRTLARSTADEALTELLGPARRGLARLLPELDPGSGPGAGETPPTWGLTLRGSSGH